MSPQQYDLGRRIADLRADNHAMRTLVVVETLAVLALAVSLMYMVITK